MRKIFLILAFIPFQNLLMAHISQADHDTLFVNLKKLESGWVQYSVDKSNSLFKKSEYTWQDWSVFFNEYYALNTFTNDLKTI